MRLAAAAGRRLLAEAMSVVGRCRERAQVRRGDSRTVHPFIEAEKRDGHNVKRAYELLQVSRAAF